MSLLSAITSGIDKVSQISGIVSGISNIFGQSNAGDPEFNLGLPTANTYSASPSVRPTTRGTGLVPLTGSTIARGGSFGGAGASGSYGTTIDGQVVRIRKRRRMNPMNVRAARRAIRRVRAARKMLMQIERSLPKARTTRRANPRSFRGAGGNTFVREG